MRPGLSSGRLCLALAFLVLVAGQLRAHELLSWWNRDLLETRFVAGDWVSMASLEERDGEAYADTLRCEVLAAEGSRRWLEWIASHGLERWLVEIDISRIGSGESVLDLVTTLYRSDEQGDWHLESLDELAESAIVRGRLEDPFESPQIERVALADSSIAGDEIARERITLHEQRERRIALGRQSMDYRWTIHSEATLSPNVPIFGVLESASYSEESTQRFDADERPVGVASPPRRSSSWLRCLGFGGGVPRGLPEVLEAQRGKR